VVIPYAWDQFFWGERLFHIGVATRPVSRGELSAGALARALEEVLRGRDMKARAAAVGQTVSRERGVENAVKVIAGGLGDS
jgi:sterol 3beta-glucosyltransferase